MNPIVDLKATIALVQLTCHPSLRLGESFLSWEPFLDNEGTGPLETLWDNDFHVDDLQKYCRDRYLLWHRARLAAIVHWFDRLDDLERPDVIVFPEGSIPRKFLSCLYSKLSRHGHSPTIFAGTHSFEWSKEAWQDYMALGVAEEQLKELLASEIESLSVCPILHQGGKSVTLQPKQLLSPWEITAIGLSQGSTTCTPTKVVHKLSEDTEFTINAFVCSEALQQLGTNPQTPDLLVVLSHNRDFSRFAALEEHYSKNQIPVAYCNDGRFGGSHVHVVNDARNENWFARSPRSGSLPSGDGILLLQTNLRRVAPTSGINNPLPTSRLLRLSSILPEDPRDSSYRVSCTMTDLKIEVSRMIRDGKPLETEKIAARCAQLEDFEKPLPIQKIQLKRLLGLARNNATPTQEWRAFASDAVVTKSHFRDALKILTKFNVLQLDREQEFAQGNPVLPCNLQVLERQLTEYCLHGLTAISESATGIANKVVVSTRARLLKHLGVTRSLSPNGALALLLQDMRREAYDAAKSHLSYSVAQIVEKYGATSGMLFVTNERVGPKSEKETTLVSTVMVNTPIPYIERRLNSDDGIVGHVGLTRRPYLADRVVTDALEMDAFLDNHYRPLVPNTMSEVAVPIVSTAIDGKTAQLIGVLNLESRRAGAFSAVQIQSLQAEVMQLMVDIRVIQSFNDPQRTVVWHPKEHGWGLHETLNRVCHRIATTHSFGRTPPSVSCTIWHADQPKKVLYVLGTSRYDFEYVCDEMLDQGNSFLGLAMENLKDGGVLTGKVEDLPRFSRRRKAERMELDKVTVSKFGKSNATDSGLSGLLVIYGFSHEATEMDTNPDAEFTRDTVSRLALTVGQIIEEMLQQRKLCALAHQSAAIASSSASSIDQLNHARIAICEALECSQATVFTISGPKARIVSTSGVDHPTQTYTIGASELDSEGREKGFTRFLASNSGLTLRKHDATDPDETCRMGQKLGQIIPENKICELGAITTSEHRRFLGASISEDEGVVGTIRLIRNEHERPFNVADEELISVLATQLAPVTSSISLSEDFQVTQKGASQSWNQRSLYVWLQEFRKLCNPIFDECNSVLTSIRYVVPDGHGDWILRLLSFHSTVSKSCRKTEEETSRRRPNIGWLTIDSSQSDSPSSYKPRIITFDRPETKLYACGIEQKVEVNSGVCLPLSWIGVGRLIPAVVAIDFKGKISPTGENIGQLFFKTLELSEMSRREAKTSFRMVPPCVSYAETLNRWMSSYSAVFEISSIYWRPCEEAGFSSSDLVASVGDGIVGDHELDTTRGFERKYNRWDPHLSFFTDAESSGIRILKNTIWIPLRIGPFALFGFFGKVSPSWIKQNFDRIERDVKDRLKRDSKLRDDSEEAIRANIESSFSGSLEELFTCQAILEFAEEIQDVWLEIVKLDAGLWQEWRILFEECQDELPPSIDRHGLRMWKPILKKINGTTPILQRPSSDEDIPG